MGQVSASDGGATACTRELFSEFLERKVSNDWGKQQKRAKLSVALPNME